MGKITEIQIGCEGCIYLDVKNKTFGDYYCKKFKAVLHNDSDGWKFRKNWRTSTYYYITNCKHFQTPKFILSEESKTKAETRMKQNESILAGKENKELYGINTIQEYKIIL